MFDFDEHTRVRKLVLSCEFCEIQNMSFDFWNFVLSICISRSGVYLLIRECTPECLVTKCEGKDRWWCFVPEARKLQCCLDPYSRTGCCLVLHPLFFWLQLYIGPTLVGYLGWPYNDYVSNGVKKRRREKRIIRKGCDFATSLWIWTRGSQRSWEKREEEQVFIVACELWMSSLFLYKFCYVLLVEKQKGVSNNKNLKWDWYFFWGGCCVCGLRLFNVEFHLKEKEKKI